MSALPMIDESLRLQELKRYGVMDTEQEEAYDEIVKLAAYICETPIALISLVDEERQWFKARYGLDAKFTPRDIAFCSGVLPHPDRFFIVPDATLDERFSNNPFVVEEPSIRFYAGAPLVTPQNFVLGALCVIDYVPRTLNMVQKTALYTLSQQVITLLEQRRTRRCRKLLRD